MRALTLWPEWAHAVLHLGKRIENRSRKMPDALVGEPIALHAGKHVGGRPGGVACDEGCESLAKAHDAEAGGDMLDWNAHYFPYESPTVWARDGVIRPIVTSSIVAVVRFGASIENVGQLPPPWSLSGSRYWWPIEEVTPLRVPAYCRGALGLWTLPEDVERVVIEEAGRG